MNPRLFGVVLSLALVLLANCAREISTEPTTERRYYFGPEGAELPIYRILWTQASYPEHLSPETQSVYNCGQSFSWYNPYSQYPIKFIWPDAKLTAKDPQTTNILFFNYRDAGDQHFSSGGVMRYLGDDHINFAERDFVEIMVNAISGTLHIDIGAISEDIIPNLKLDSEDILQNQIRNGVLDAGEDIGLDGMANDDPRALAAGGDFWDINGDGIKDAGEPFSFDDWSYNPKSPDEAYEHANGTEENETDSGGATPNTEDLNSNGFLDLANDYWSYQIHLAHDHPDHEKYVVNKPVESDTTSDYGWRWYRIPLADYAATVGSPSVDNVQHIRLWFTDTTAPAQVFIAFVVLTAEGENN